MATISWLDDVTDIVGFLATNYNSVLSENYSFIASYSPDPEHPETSPIARLTGCNLNL